MEAEVMETVLTELLQELKEIKEQQADTSRLLHEVKGKIEGFEQKFRDGITNAPAAEEDVITQFIKEGFDRVKTAIDSQPKSITKQFRIILFPEHNATKYYKLVFGRLLFWMMTFLVATYLFVLCKQSIESHFKAKQIEAEASQYTKAWIHLYQNSTKGIKKKMDSAWIKTWLKQ